MHEESREHDIDAEQFVIEQWGDLAGRARRIVYSYRVDPDDVLAETLLRLWQAGVKIASRDMRGKLAWYTLTMVNVARELDRHRDPPPRALDAKSCCGGSESDPPSEVIVQEILHIVMEVLSEMPDDQRVVWELAWCGLTQEAIAEQLGLSRQKVRTRLKKARERIRNRLRCRGYGLEKGSDGK